MDSASTSSYFQRRASLKGRVKRARSQSDEDNEPLQKRHARQHARPARQKGYRSHGLTSINPADQEEDTDVTKSVDLGSYDTTSDPSSDGAVDLWPLNDDVDLEATDEQVGNEPDIANTANNHNNMDAMPQSNSHTSQGPGADEDILHFCRRMGYVPAGTPIPTGSRIQPFLKLKPVRGLDLNRCSTAHPWHPNNKGNSNWYALLTQVSGRIAPHPCTKCARGAARWTPCVVPSTPDTWSLVNGACACCLYSNQGANCSFVKDARQVPDIDNTTLAPHTSFFPPEAARAAPEVNTVANLANPALAAHPATRPTTAVRASPVTSSPWAGNTLLESHTPRATTAAAVLNAHPRPSVFLPPISSFDLKPPGTLTPSPVPAYNMSRLDDFGAPDAFPNTSLDASYGPTAFPIPKPDPFGHINTAYGPRPDFRSGPTVGHGVNASSGAAGRFGGSWSGPAPHGAFNKENEIYPTTGRDAICTARPPPVPGRTPSFGTRYALASKPTFEPVPSFGHEMGPYDSKTAAGPGRMHHPLLPYDGSHRHVAERGRVLADRDQWEEDQRDEIMHDVCINSAKLAELAAEQCRLVTKLQFVGKARRC